VSLAFKMKLEGGDQAIRALRVLEPTVARRVTKEVSKAGKLVAALIESRAPKEPPMSGWRTIPTSRPHTKNPSRGGAGWNSEVVFSAISASSRASNMSVIIRTESNNYAAIIYESAGVKGGRFPRGDGRSGDGMQFIANLERKSPIVQSGKYQGRLARKAIADKYPEFIRQLEFACDQAVDEINKRLP